MFYFNAAPQICIRATRTAKTDSILLARILLLSNQIPLPMHRNDSIAQNSNLVRPHRPNSLFRQLNLIGSANSSQ
jgi:hypothetical protein